MISFYKFKDLNILLNINLLSILIKKNHNQLINDIKIKESYSDVYCTIFKYYLSIYMIKTKKYENN